MTDVEEFPVADEFLKVVEELVTVPAGVIDVEETMQDEKVLKYE